jgi:RNA polymerase sigma-70 factor (ECF subfamily)
VLAREPWSLARIRQHAMAAASGAATDGATTAEATENVDVFVIPFMALPQAEAAAAVGLDRESFRAFYEEALPRVYGYFLHRCGGSAALAEDLTQETFLACVRELKREKRVEAPIAWIYGIARHKLVDHYRRQEREERSLALAYEAEEREEELVVSDDPASRERAIAALAAVAPAQRSALVLCYVDGLSMAETARALGKSVEAVESLLARGRQRFKRAYLEGVSA